METSAKSQSVGTRPRLLAIGTDRALLRALQQLAGDDAFTLETASTLRAARDAIAHTVGFRSRRDVVLVEPFLHGEYAEELVPALNAMPCAPAIGVLSAHLTPAIRTHWTRILDKTGTSCAAAVLALLRSDGSRRVAGLDAPARGPHVPAAKNSG